MINYLLMSLTAGSIFSSADAPPYYDYCGNKKIIEFSIAESTQWSDEYFDYVMEHNEAYKQTCNRKAIR